MSIKKTNPYYLLLKNWWENIELTNYEKTLLNEEIISFNQQLIRLKENQIRIGIFGKAGVGKSSILNLLLKEEVFETNIINGSTKKIETKEWEINHQSLNIELVDTPGFDICNDKFSDTLNSKTFNSELVLFAIAGDLNRNEVNKLNSLINDGKKIIIILNKINVWNKYELKEILKNVGSKLPKNSNIPIIKNSENNIEHYLNKIITRYGETLLTLNSLQLADKLFLKIKEQRLKKRKKEAQSIIGKFATIKASSVAINPLLFFDIAGSFAIDTVLISELSKVYGLTLKGKSAREIIKKVSINNWFLGATQVSINTSFNLIRKIILTAAPFTHGISLLPYGPIALIQAAIAIRSTKIIGKLAARELLRRSKISGLDPSTIIQKIILNEPEIHNHINFYLSSRNIRQKFPVILP